MSFNQFVELLDDCDCKPKGGDNKVAALCPAHDDTNPSLSASEGEDGRILIHCHAGCSVDAVCDSLGIGLGDLFAHGEGPNGTPKRIVGTYPYHDANGKLLFEVVRYVPKDFRQRQPHATQPNAWVWNIKGINKILFRLPEVLADIQRGLPIYVCEGEKDVLALVKRGFAATCNSGGAGKWQDTYTETLRNADVIIIADKDETGRGHAAKVAGKLHTMAKSVKVVECPGEAVKDAADYFAAGGNADQLGSIVDSTPIWTPSDSAASAEAMDGEEALAAQYGQPMFFKPGTTNTISSLNERFFAAHFHRSRQILFEPGEASFFDYETTTGLWKRVSDDYVREAIAAGIFEYGRQHDLSLESKITTARIGAILQALRGISERRDVFTQHGDLNRIHVQNGVIRFGTDFQFTLTDFRPEDYSRNRCPISFVPDANCPRFINELLAPALEREDIDLLQRIAGLAIAGVNPAQRFLILDGLPATGKSTIASLIWKLVGKENCVQLRTNCLFERFELFRFVGKTMLMAPDVPGNFLNQPSASVLKSLVGGDPLTAEAKGSNEVITLEGRFNVVITANTRLRVRLDGDAGAWARRIIILRFAGQPAAKRIPNFDEVLMQEEGPGILRWALAGFLAAREQIEKTGDLSLSASQEERIEELLSESDSLRLFLDECTEIGRAEVTTNDMVEAYFRFCANYQWTPQPARTVERGLKELILQLYGKSQSHDVDGSRGWHGIKLKAFNTEPAQEPDLAYALH